jgi:hypothetical protein
MSDNLGFRAEKIEEFFENINKKEKKITFEK